MIITLCMTTRVYKLSSFVTFVLNYLRSNFSANIMKKENFKN